MDYLTVGQIVKTIGLKGEVKIYPSTHFRDSRFSKGSHVFLLDENKNVTRELTIKQHRSNGDCDMVIFNEIGTIDEAETIIHSYLYVEKDRNFLKKDQYFFSDLEGLDVEFDNGNYIGKVGKVEEYTSTATLRVKTNGKDVLIPFVNAFIKSVSLEDKKIIINFIEGLL